LAEATASTNQSSAPSRQSDTHNSNGVMLKLKEIHTATHPAKNERNGSNGKPKKNGRQKPKGDKPK